MNQTLLEALRIDAHNLQTELNNESDVAARAENERLAEEYFTRVSTADEMLAKSYGADDALLDPLLPRQGVVALVGSSDSGKSSLLRGLAMAIVAGKQEYIGFALYPRYRRAIYISTEDDEASLSKLMRMQIIDGDIKAYSGLHFIFDTDNLLETIELGMRSNTPDIVIIDAFADLYTGPMNENNRVRSFINAFSQLAVKYNTLFIFLHHTGKRTESLTPSKHNAIGSQGFEAKMRLMMELRPDPERHDIRHLCVVKGNYLPSEYKHDSFELRFTPSLNFEATGERVPFGLLKERTDLDDKAEIARTMRLEGKTLQEIAEELGYKSVASVHTLLKRD